MKVVNGVGLLLFNPDGRILLLKELESKPHYGKVAGMVSFPIETIEEGETSDQAVSRLIVEEVGEPMQDTPTFFERFMIRLNGSFIEQLDVYQVRCVQTFIARPNDTDIEHFGWMFPHQILNLARCHIRLEVEPVMSSYLSR